MESGGCVYIMTNLANTVLYVGVSSDLYSRVYDHRNKTYPNSFTAQYNCVKLVYYQQFTTIEEAIDREKQLKNWAERLEDQLDK